MPQLTRVMSDEDLRRKDRASRMDLSAYTDMIEQVRTEGGVGGEIALTEGESKRTEKRRLSIAAKEAGTTLIWRKSQDGTLRFVLTEEGTPAPGSRTRRDQSAGAAAAAPVGRGRRTGTESAA